MPAQCARPGLGVTLWVECGWSAGNVSGWMQNLLPFFPLLVFAVFLPMLILGALAARRRTEENLQKLAAQLGLAFQPEVGWSQAPRVAGELRGKPVAVFLYSTGSGRSRVSWAAITVQLTRPSGLSFTLEKQGLGAKLAELFGAREITLGDARFDAAWFVQTNQPEFLSAALIPELREKLMAVQGAGARGKFELKDGLVKYAEQGSLADAKLAERFVALADLVGDLADLVGDLADLAEVAGTSQGQA